MFTLQKKKFFDKCRDDKMTKTRWKSTFQLFLFLFLYFLVKTLSKKKLVNIYSPAAELSWIPKDISCFLMSSSSATIAELCLFLPRKIVGVAGGTKNTKENYLFFFDTRKRKTSFWSSTTTFPFQLERKIPHLMIHIVWN